MYAAAPARRRGSWVVAKLMRISVLGRGVRVEQRARRDQPALVEQRFGQPLGVAAGIDPAEQAARRRGEGEAVRASAASTVRARAASSRCITRSTWRRSRPCSRQWASARSVSDGEVSVDSSLVSTSRSTQAGGAAR